MVRVQASVSKGWLHKNGGFNFNQRYYLDPYNRMQQDEKCHQFIKNVGELISVKKVLNLPFIKKLEEQYLQAKEKYRNCTIIPPFFWDPSGRATIHGIVTTSMKFIGQDIFTKMMTDAETVKGIHLWITNVYIEVINHFSNLAKIPVTSIHVGECSGTMLDESSYKEFVTPYINQLGREFGGVRLHSCGNADHVIKTICQIENLRIIDTGSNTSLAKIRKILGNDFEINVFPPVEVLTEGSERKDICITKSLVVKVLPANGHYSLGKQR